MRSRLASLAVALIALVAPGRPAVADSGDFVLTRFEQYLESLRQQAAIPGLSAAIVSTRQIIWERGFGFQDVENSVRATPATPYHVVDLTQTFAATLLLDCVDRGELELDDPMRRFARDFPEASATVRHVLSHTSRGTPGAGFRYDPGRYGFLGAAVESCAGEPFRKVLADWILDRTGMQDSVPGQDLADGGTPDADLFDGRTLERYARVVGRIAKPYRVDRRGRPSVSDFPTREIGPATGLIATVRDLAEYSIALDNEILLSRDALTAAWSNGRSRDGATLPFGLGWFIQSYNGERVIWHFGKATDSYSSLIVKVPGRNLTLILLANSDGLSQSFSLEEGDVTTSLFARLFLRLFV